MSEIAWGRSPMTDAMQSASYELARHIDALLLAGLNAIVGVGYAYAAAARGDVTGTMYRYRQTGVTETAYTFCGDPFLVVTDQVLAAEKVSSVFALRVGFRYYYTGRCTHLNRG